MKHSKDRHGVPFYDRDILRHQEQEYIEHLLKKFKGLPATPALKKQIWEELMMEKYLGRISIPFQVVLRKDSHGNFPEFIEVILDTKV